MKGSISLRGVEGTYLIDGFLEHVRATSNWRSEIRNSRLEFYLIHPNQLALHIEYRSSNCHLVSANPAVPFPFPVTINRRSNRTRPKFPVILIIVLENLNVI